MRHAIALPFLAAALAACTPADAPAGAPVDATTPAPTATETAAEPAAGGEVGAAAVAPPAPAGAVDPDTLSLDFRGDALAWARANGHAAPAALSDATRAKATAEATAEDCSHWAEGDRALASDLDGDGRDEGITAYTLEACGGGGNNYVRTLVVWRDVAGAWTPVLDVPLGTKVGGNRAVTALSADSITVAGGGEPFDSDAPPETVTIPLAATR